MSPVPSCSISLWIVLGGFGMAVGWVIAAVIMAITIIGIPWARAAFNIAMLHAAAVRPEGGVARRISRPGGHRHRAARRRRQHHLAGAGRLVAGARPPGASAIVLAITIIGIPFAWAHLKLAALALWPIGKMIVPIDVVPLPYPRRD